MVSPVREKIGYVKDRIVNALWMIRHGKFKLIVKSIYIETNHRVMKLKVLILHGRNPDYSKLPGSAHVDKRKVIPPSYRPTHSQCAPPPILQVDKKLIADEIDNIRLALIARDHSQP